MRERLTRFMRDRRKLIGPTAHARPVSDRGTAPSIFCDGPEYVAHRGTVEAEIAKVDRHARAVAGQLAVVGAGGSFERQELHAELRQLAVLRAELVAELDRPICGTRDGRPITDQMRAHVRARTAELREQGWHAADRAEREGDHRRARQLRRDALRARALAEHEAGLRSSLPGYTTPW
jgi:hypothetical protein